MRRSTLFWGAIFILLGLLLLLRNIGVLAFDVWGVFWPIVLIALGIWVLWRRMGSRTSFEQEEVRIPLEGAMKGRIRLRHGAGRMRITGDGAQDDLIMGSFGGGLDFKTRREEDDTLFVDMRTPDRVFPMFGWDPGTMLNWTFNINSQIPISLDLETGASENDLDLNNLLVSNLRLQTGASSTRITMPARAGHTQARISAGAASVRVRIPEGVAARIRVHSGLSSISVDRNRFPRQGDVYQSSDFETAMQKLDIDVETGVGSIDIQ